MDEIVARLRANDASLTSLNLEGNGFGEGGAVALAEAVKVSTSLTSLNLSYNDVGDGGAKLLLSGLAAKERRVGWTWARGDLGVGERCFVAEIMNGATWGALVRVFLTENCLTDLDLSHNNISTYDSICELYELRMLKKLNLSNNKMCGTIHSRICQLINLEYIDLSDNNLTNLDLALFVLPCLKECKLRGNLNLKQPPLFEAVKGLIHLRSYAQQQMVVFNTLKLAIVGDENVGKTVLTYRLIGNIQEAERNLNLDRHQGERSGETRGIHHEKLTVADLQLVIWDYVS
jgi:Leucine-rich repeat (LRR) protein